MRALFISLILTYPVMSFGLIFPDRCAVALMAVGSKSLRQAFIAFSHFRDVQIDPRFRWSERESALNFIMDVGDLSLLLKRSIDPKSVERELNEIGAVRDSSPEVISAALKVSRHARLEHPELIYIYFADHPNLRNPVELLQIIANKDYLLDRSRIFYLAALILKRSTLQDLQFANPDYVMVQDALTDLYRHSRLTAENILGLYEIIFKNICRHGRGYDEALKSLLFFVERLYGDRSDLPPRASSQRLLEVVRGGLEVLNNDLTRQTAITKITTISSLLGL